MAAAVENLVPPKSIIPTGPRLVDGNSLAEAIQAPHGLNTQDSITASTTQTQAGGTTMNSGITRITSANASDAVTINRPAAPGKWMVIINDSGQTVQLFPKLGDKINDAATNAAVTIADNTVSVYFCPVVNKWFGGAITLET